MSSDTKAVPDGFHTVTPGIVVNNGAEALEFYKRAFGAEVVFSMTTPDGSKVVHSEVRIGNSVIFVTDEFPDMGSKSPAAFGGSSVSLNLYVEDADAAFNKAVEAGATPVMPVEEMFWGDRWGMVTDPYGHMWTFSTHVKDLTPEEIEQASHAFFSKMASGA